MGSSSPKPTNVLVVNMPELVLTLHANRVRVELPNATSIGKEAEGRWCTSAFKECAPPLCRSLAISFARALQSTDVDPGC